MPVNCRRYPPGYPPGTKPVYQNKAGARLHTELLGLVVVGSGKSLHRVRREHELGTSRQCCVETMEGLTRCPIPIHLRRGLSRKEAVKALSLGISESGLRRGVVHSTEKDALGQGKKDRPSNPGHRNPLSTVDQAFAVRGGDGSQRKTNPTAGQTRVPVSVQP